MLHRQGQWLASADDHRGAGDRAGVVTRMRLVPGMRQGTVKDQGDAGRRREWRDIWEFPAGPHMRRDPERTRAGLATDAQ